MGDVFLLESIGHLQHQRGDVGRNLQVNPEGPERDPKKTEERVNVKGSDTRDDVYTQWELVPKGGDKYMIRFPGVKGQILPKYLSAKTDNSVDFVVKEEGEKMGAETWHFEPEGTKGDKFKIRALTKDPKFLRSTYEGGITLCGRRDDSETTWKVTGFGSQLPHGGAASSTGTAEAERAVASMAVADDPPPAKSASSEPSAPAGETFIIKSIGHLEHLKGESRNLQVNPDGPERDPKKTANPAINVKGADNSGDKWMLWHLISKGGDKYILKSVERPTSQARYLAAKTDNSIEYVAKDDGDKMGNVTWHLEPEGTKGDKFKIRASTKDPKYMRSTYDGGITLSARRDDSETTWQVISM